MPTSISQLGPPGVKKNRCEPEVEWELTPQLSQWEVKKVLRVVLGCLLAPPQPSTHTTVALARRVSASRYPIRREYFRLSQCSGMTPEQEVGVGLRFRRMVEPARPADSESAAGLWTLGTAAALVFVAICIVSARVGASGLPAPCDVSRPNLEAAVWVAFGGAVVSWLLAVYGMFRMRSAWWLRLAFAFIAALEVLAWLAALHYYRRWGHLYNGGNCL